MYNPDAAVLFPAHAITALHDLRGAVWQGLVTKVLETDPDSMEQMAFVLMMARMNNCATCNADSFRATTGCSACSKQTLKRTRETDERLVEMYQATKVEVEQYLQKTLNGNPLNQIQLNNR